MAVLGPDEENVMKMTMKAAFLRAADIIDKITESDVLDMQARLLGSGVSLQKTARVDRAMVASHYLRAIASGEVAEIRQRQPDASPAPAGGNAG